MVLKLLRVYSNMFPYVNLCVSFRGLEDIEKIEVKRVCVLGVHH
jgi:hypothetical protein